MIRSLQIRIFGKVQGVWFRVFVRDQIKELGLSGIVQNEDDGSVFIETTGEEDVLKKLIEACYVGPPLAKVERVEWEEYGKGD